MKILNLILFSAILMFSQSCSSPATESEVESDEQLLKRAVVLAQTNIMIDGHVDIPYRLRNHPEDISGRTAGGHFDYVRAKEGGLNAPIMSIYIPSEKENDGAKARPQDRGGRGCAS